VSYLIVIIIIIIIITVIIIIHCSISATLSDNNSTPWPSYSQDT